MKPKFQDLTSAIVPSHFRGNNKVVVQLWYLVQVTFFRMSPHFMVGWRRFLLRLFGARVGRAVHVRPSADITYPWNVSLGDHSYIGDEVILYSLDRIEIGAHVAISCRAFLCAGTHDPYDPAFPLVIKPISVCNEAWLGVDSFVAPGVRIGMGAILGARSSAFKDVPDMDVQVGTPARSIGTRQQKPRGV